MIEDFKIGIKLSLVSDVARKLGALSAAFSDLNKESDVYQKKINDLELSQKIVNAQLEKRLALSKSARDIEQANMTHALRTSKIEQQIAKSQDERLAAQKASERSFGSHAGMLGLGMVGVLGYAVTKAAELQKVMIGIQVATSGSAKDMNDMRGAIEAASRTTMFNDIQVAKMANLVATSTNLSANQVSSVLPAYAKFADVQLLLKGTDSDTSTRDAINIAHLSGRYDATGLQDILETVTKASLVMPGGVGELARALKYSLPRARATLGVNPKDMIMMTALANTMGFAGSIGGTNVIDSMVRTIPGIFGSGLLTGKSNEALRHMNLVDSQGHSKLFENGTFSFDKWMKGLSDFVAHDMATMPKALAYQDIAISMQHAFGAQGGRYASVLSTPQAIAQWQGIQAKYNRLESLNKMQNAFNQGSVSQQFNTMTSNLTTVMIELGYNLLPIVLAALKKINAALVIFIPWMRAHADLVKKLEYGFIGLAAAMGLVAVGFLTFVGIDLIGIAVGLTAMGYAIKKLWDIVKTINWKNLLPSFAPGESFNSAFNKYEASQKGKGWFHSWHLPHFGGDTTVHTNINIDGRHVAKVVSKAQSKAAATPSSTASNHDPYSTMISPAFVGVN